MLFNRVWNPSAEFGHANEAIQKIGHTATPMGDANIKVWVSVENATKDQGGNGHQLLIGVAQ